MRLRVHVYAERFRVCIIHADAYYMRIGIYRYIYINIYM